MKKLEEQIADAEDNIYRRETQLDNVKQSLRRDCVEINDVPVTPVTKAIGC